MTSLNMEENPVIWTAKVFTKKLNLPNPSHYKFPVPYRKNTLHQIGKKSMFQALEKNDQKFCLVNKCVSTVIQ